jgi:hypothetical protein
MPTDSQIKTADARCAVRIIASGREPSTPIPVRQATALNQVYELQVPALWFVQPDEATRCDCGYDFVTKTVQSSYLVADTVRKHGGEEKFAEETARGNIRTGTILLAVGAIVAGIGYAGGGKLYFGGAIMFGAVLLYRGFRQRRAHRKHET